MSKISLAVVLAFLLSAQSAMCDGPFSGQGLYRAYFAPDFIQAHNMDPNAQYIVKVIKVSASNPNWVLVEFPQEANQSYTSSMGGQRWVNLTYISEFKAYTPPGQ